MIKDLNHNFHHMLPRIYTLATTSGVVVRVDCRISLIFTGTHSFEFWWKLNTQWPDLVRESAHLAGKSFRNGVLPKIEFSEIESVPIVRISVQSGTCMHAT
jgi:hypothetical protein